MTNESANQDPKPLGEILEDPSKVIRAQTDPARASKVGKIVAQNDVAELEEVRAAIIGSIVEARDENTDESLDRLAMVEEALLAAQADEIDARGQTDTSGN